jgi:UDP-N-acetylmuramate dehydrogenase
VLTRAVSEGLAGLEVLVGIPGTVGGAVRGNAGGRSGEIGELVNSVSVMTHTGEKLVRTEDDLSFAYRSSGINDLLILDVEFQLTKEDPDEIARRMRKLWIMKKSTQPLSFQSAGCIFKNPRGLSAGALVEQAGLKGTRLGQCEVSDRHGNFIVTYEGATSADVLRLIDLIRTKVAEKHGVQLELEIQIW